MGMYNAIIDDELLNPLGVYKERLSQSALWAEMQRVGDDEAKAVGEWLLAQGMTFQLGTDEATELTAAQLHLAVQDVHRRAAHHRRLRPRRGRHPVPAGPQGPRPRVRPRRGAAQQRRPAPGDQPRRAAGAVRGTGPAALQRGGRGRRRRRAGHQPGVDARWAWTRPPRCTTCAGARTTTGGSSGSSRSPAPCRRRTSRTATPARSGWRQDPMYFPAGGATIKGVAKPGRVVWSRRLHRGRRAAPRHRPRRRGPAARRGDRAALAATNPEWPIMHVVLHGVTRDQFMARHKANHVQVAYAPTRTPPTWPSRRRRPPSPRSASRCTCAAMSPSSPPADGLPAGGLPVGGQAPGGPAADAPADSAKCRWGVIGAGRIAGEFVAGIGSSRTGTLVAVASSGLARARALADAAGPAGRVAVYGDYTALLADPRRRRGVHRDPPPGARRPDHGQRRGRQARPVREAADDDRRAGRGGRRGLRGRRGDPGRGDDVPLPAADRARSRGDRRRPDRDAAARGRLVRVQHRVRPGRPPVRPLGGRRRHPRRRLLRHVLRPDGSRRGRLATTRSSRPSSRPAATWPRPASTTGPWPAWHSPAASPRACGPGAAWPMTSRRASTGPRATCGSRTRGRRERTGPTLTCG